jgi:antitoxin ParD1/3/4
VGSGGYSSVSEVIREAMRGWLERERRLANLDAAIAKGVADVDAGRVRALEDVRRDFTERCGGKHHG